MPGGKLTVVSEEGDQVGEAAGRKTLPNLERGRDLSRIFAFTDGVFAIAITLLVLQIEVPKGLTSGSGFLNELNDEVPNFIAFGLSFAVIGFYWVGSHRAMRMVREYDRGLMLLTLLYLAFIVLLPYSSQLLGEYGSEIPLTVVFYIGNLVAITVAMALMFRHMASARLAHPDYEWAVELEEKSLWFSAGFFALTVPFVWLFGTWALLLWVLLRFDPYQRKRDRIQAAGGPQNG